MVQISSNGEIIKNIFTYPKINICSHHICSSLHESSDPLSLLPNFVIKACRIDLVYSIYFWFSFYCACASFFHRLMYLYALSEMEKRRCFIICKIKVCSPLDTANPLYHKLILSIYIIYVSGKLGQGGGGSGGGGGGGQYSVSRRRCVVRIQFGKNILKWPWKWG